MKNNINEKITRERLYAYLDGKLDEKETAEIDEMVERDPELRRQVDEYTHLQFEMMNAQAQAEGEEDAVSLPAMNAIKAAIQRVEQSDSEVTAKQRTKTRKPLWITIAAACVVAVLVLASGMFSPYAYQVGEPVQVDFDEELARGGDVFDADTTDIYEALLVETDHAIAERENTLPTLPFFDRFRSGKEEIQRTRAEVYELRWRRIECLQQLGRSDELREELNEFVKIDGYRKAEAEQILSEVN